MSCSDECSRIKNRGTSFSLSGTLRTCMGRIPASDLFPGSEDQVKPTELTPQSGVISNQYKPEPDTGYEGFDTSDRDVRGNFKVPDVMTKAGRPMVSSDKTAKKTRGTLRDEPGSYQDRNMFDTDSDDNVPDGYDPTEYRRAAQEYRKKVIDKSIAALGERVERTRVDVDALRESIERGEETLTVARRIPQLRKEIARDGPIHSFLLMKRATGAALSSQAGPQSAPPTESLPYVKSETLDGTVKPEGSEVGEEA